MCQKIRYASRAEAKAEGRRMSRYGGKPRPYVCPDSECGGAWHLTSSYTARDSRRIGRKKAA
jgi:hypothetical protein